LLWLLAVGAELPENLWKYFRDVVFLITERLFFKKLMSFLKEWMALGVSVWEVASFLLLKFYITKRIPSSWFRSSNLKT
jgi:hypothetical protein